LPDVLLAGGMRCGTSSMFRYLKAAGCVGSMLRKEVHYFDRHVARGEWWYRSFFPLRPSGPVVDATPSYLTTPGVAARAAALVPDARVLVVMRHPAVRAVSHFGYRRGRGHEPLARFEDALADEPARMARGDLFGCYAHHSRYEVGLREWLDHFPSEQLCVLLSERIFAADPEEFARLDAFLGLPGGTPFPHVNAGPPERPTAVAGLDVAATIAAVEELIGRPTGWEPTSAPR
jgi:hypothetical protein